MTAGPTTSPNCTRSIGQNATTSSVVNTPALTPLGPPGELVRAYLADGIRFFILERPTFRPAERVHLMADTHLMKMVENGTVELFKFASGTLEFVGSTRDVSEILSRHSAALPAGMGE